MEIHILSPQFSGDPEAVAMLQAFYSRSSESIVSRLARLGNDLTSVKKALARFYVGYGHQSIGDCGNVTIFIEGVSILAAKAIQEDPLYNGQECSTRYIELTDGLHSPSKASEWWLKEYGEIKAAVLKGVRTEHPFEPTDGFDINNHEHTKPGTAYATWLNATEARAFDVARGWIPANAKTNLSWSTSLRKAAEATTRLKGHPVNEVRNIADEIRAKLCATYPSGIAPFTDKDDAKAAWCLSSPKVWFNMDYEEDMKEPHIAHTRKLYDLEYSRLITLINERPRHMDLPHWMEALTTFSIKGHIDFGTWRDLQRHRRCIGRPPLLKPNDFHSWYLEEVQRYVPGQQGADFACAAINQIQRQKLEWQKAKTFDFNQFQYDCPLGTVIQYDYQMGLAQAVYLAELRSGNTVHAILRPIAQYLAQHLTDMGIRVDYDALPGRFDLKRGTQTIHEKESV